MSYRSLLSAILLLALAACGTVPETPSTALNLQKISFDHLPAWSDDHLAEAIPALVRSCKNLTAKTPTTALGIAGKVSDWQPLCREVTNGILTENEVARYFFEQNFTPYRVKASDDSDTAANGLFTGYYEPYLYGAKQRGGIFQTPLWQKPHDMISVDLGAFKPELKGEKITGKVTGQKLVPYDNRAEIAQHGLAGRAEPLLWVDDPVGAFFLEIQGSGQVELPDGSVIRVGYDAQNGHPYVPIGRVLGARGELSGTVTMPRIRAWLADHPEQASAVMNSNPSVVFFREIKGDGPIGAQNVALTPWRSMAVDPHFIPYGVPLWLSLQQPVAVPLDNPDDSTLPSAPSEKFLQNFMVIAQDTGGAIKGAVRGDLFCGAGEVAEKVAGSLQASGTYYLLLPKTVVFHGQE